MCFFAPVKKKIENTVVGGDPSCIQMKKWNLGGWHSGELRTCVLVLSGPQFLHFLNEDESSGWALHARCLKSESGHRHQVDKMRSH